MGGFWVKGEVEEAHPRDSFNTEIKWDVVGVIEDGSNAGQRVLNHNLRDRVGFSMPLIYNDLSVPFCYYRVWRRCGCS
jgi:hypothetical protein